MKGLSLILKITAPIYLFIGALHLIIGLNADVALGANLPVDVLGDPVLDSQNRFFGVSFTIFGVLFYLCATDLEKYEKVFYCLLAVFFAGGIARLVSMAVVGAPSMQILVLTGLELLMPPLLVIWYKASVGQR